MEPTKTATAAKKRLAAIVFTDAVGSTRMIDLTEDHGIEKMRQELATIDEFARSHGGNAIKSTGDGMLLWFESVTDAVQFGIALQEYFRKRKSAGYQHRVGIHFGEVTFADNDVYGSVVNATQRIQSEAGEGGICFSQAVYDQIGRSMKLSIDTLGERALKGIPFPMVLYHVGPKKPLPKAVVSTPAKRRSNRWIKKFVTASVLALAVGTGAALVSLPEFRQKALALLPDGTAQAAEPQRPSAPPAATTANPPAPDKKVDPNKPGDTKKNGKESPNGGGTKQDDAIQDPPAPTPTPTPPPVVVSQDIPEDLRQLRNGTVTSGTDSYLNFALVADYTTSSPELRGNRRVRLLEAEAQALARTMEWFDAKLSEATEATPVTIVQSAQGVEARIGYYFDNGLYRIVGEASEPTSREELAPIEVQRILEAMIRRWPEETGRKGLRLFRKWRSLAQ
jgi:class 3 adenylate cyclase